MTKYKVLVVGSGGRDHAVAWALAQSPYVEQIYVAPGNGGTEWPVHSEKHGRQMRAAAINISIPNDDVSRLVKFAQQEAIDFTVVGPTSALVTGIVDAFQEADLGVFGPSRQAAQLETSKSFAKDFMDRHAIPTADYQVFNDYQAAQAYVHSLEHQVVIKADGLADGKGVIVCEDKDQTQVALDTIMHKQNFGAAGQTVVIEERLEGPEISILAWSDGRTVIPMLPARDYKRLFDSDRGPNTGGMGAYAPVPNISEAQIAEICHRILEPTVQGMAAEGVPYIGVLYAGLMLTSTGPKVLEFNCRLGDPEAQALLPLLKTDLLQILLACVEGRLGEVGIDWHTAVCAAIVLTSPGYPDRYRTGLPIRGLDQATDLEKITVFQAGTRHTENEIVTAGGRVLTISAVGENLGSALEWAYQGVAQIHFDGAHYRQDIGRDYK